MTRLIEEDVFDYINFYPEVERGATFAVPNEIFTDLMGRHKFGKCAYAYTYYYLQMYLHLFAKYGTENTVDKFTTKNIQKILGISPESKPMHSITKKDGDLDQLGYTSTVTDYPVNLMRMERKDGMMEVYHYMFTEEKRDFPNLINHSPNFTVKHPDKMYWRTTEDKLDNYYNGTMNEPSNTHIIPLEMFLHAINIEDIMTKGFYVYGFIIHKNNVRGRGEGWRIPSDLFASDIGVSRKTLIGILKSLEQHNFIKIKRQVGRNGIDLPNIYLPNFEPKRVIY